MAIGSFGTKIFSTSDRRILTFRDFTYTTTPRYTEHEIIGEKPKMEYIGPGLDDITFTITLHVNLGIDVKKELESWRKMAANGESQRLIIGKKRLGKGKWSITGCSESWGVVTNKGGIISATGDITLREYV